MVSPIIKLPNRLLIRVDPGFLYRSQLPQNRSGMNLTKIKWHLDKWLMTTAMCTLSRRLSEFGSLSLSAFLLLVFPFFSICHLFVPGGREERLALN